MTWDQWSKMTRAEREAAMDRSALHPALIGLEGRKVRVSHREYGLKTFRVGRSTGWRPVHLAMRGNARGSSDVIDATEIFTVQVLA
jgi:hypothetical protein